jgi:hypothetical protein
MDENVTGGEQASTLAAARGLSDMLAFRPVETRSPISQSG